MYTGTTPEAVDFFCAGQVSSLHGPGVSQEKKNHRCAARDGLRVSSVDSAKSLVVLNIFNWNRWFGTWLKIFPKSWDDDPIWRTPSFFRWVAQPPTRFSRTLSRIFSVCEFLWFFHRCSALLPLWFSPWAPSSACETWNQRMAHNYTCTDTKLSETGSTSDATHGYSSVFFSPDEMIDHLKHLKQGELPNVFGTNDFLGLSGNTVYSQWNSHLIGIMISKTIGFRGLAYFQTHPSDTLAANRACAKSLSIPAPGAPGLDAAPGFATGAPQLWSPIN